MTRNLSQLNDYIRQESAFVRPLLAEIGRVIVGQDRLIHRLLIALLSDGHILIEGVPGLAKTLTVRTLAATLHAKFQRIQFTPDLLPSDVVGTQIYNQASQTFVPRLGPIFANLVLADEINRAPAKVQSALLECMEERQVSIGDETYPLATPFMVLATQNPIEQEGTYPLPEAQLDRFMLKVIIAYPKREEERLVIDRMSARKPDAPKPMLEADTLQRAKQAIHEIYVDEKIKDYVLDIIQATRKLSDVGALKKLQPFIEIGASPRATLALIKAAKANAFLQGRGYVTPDDVKSIVPDVLRHRIVLTFEAQAEAITTQQLILQILKQVEVP